MVSVIIPTYNEEKAIGATLEYLRRARGDFEVIVVDGGSQDSTRERIESLTPGFPRRLGLITTELNRAVQLNRAAALARGNAHLFLHADALLPPEAIENLENALRNESIVGGNFRLAFDGNSGWSRFFTWVNHLRRAIGIYYGDSGLFVRREVFRDLGGFKPLPIMDDYEFVRRMEKFGRTAYLPSVVIVSDRRWRVQGVFRTLLSWVWVQGLYSMGVPARYLARWYRPVRDTDEARSRHRQSPRPAFLGHARNISQRPSCSGALLPRR